MVAFFSRLKRKIQKQQLKKDFGVVAFFSRLKLLILFIIARIYFGVVAFFSRLKLKKFLIEEGRILVW